MMDSDFEHPRIHQLTVDFLGLTMLVALALLHFGRDSATCDAQLNG